MCTYVLIKSERGILRSILELGSTGFWFVRLPTMSPLLEKILSWAYPRKPTSQVLVASDMNRLPRLEHCNLPQVHRRYIFHDQHIVQV